MKRRRASIQQLRAFIAVAQSCSLSEASERIHLSQPAISIALRKLEETTGGALFARTSRQLTLTPEGETFLPVAIRLLDDWTEAFQDLGELFSKKRGKVTLAAMPTLAAELLPSAVAIFHARYPQVNLALHEMLSDQINQMVREGRADIGLSVPPQESEDLAFEPVLLDHYVAVCPLDHPLLEQEVVEWRQLANYPFISIQRQSHTRKVIDRVMAEQGHTFRTLCDASQATVGRMVAAGLGISVLPKLSFRQIATKGLGHRPLVSPELSRPLGIVTRRRQPLSVATIALQEILLNRSDQGELDKAGLE